MKTLSEEPSEEQLAALRMFAAKYGRRWKDKLGEAWMTGWDVGEPHGHLLRQLRNQFGPQWLEKFK